MDVAVSILSFFAVVVDSLFVGSVRALKHLEYRDEYCKLVADSFRI